MKIKILVGLISLGLLGCASPDKVDPNPEIKLPPGIHSCTPKPFGTQAGGDPPAALTTYIFAAHQFEISLPENWLLGTRLYPKGENQNHEVFVVSSRGKHNISGYGCVGIGIRAIKKSEFASWNEFFADRCDQNQVGDIPCFIGQLDSTQYLCYRFCWEKYPNIFQYTEVVFVVGDKFYYEFYLDTETEDRLKYHSCFIKVLNSLRIRY